MKRLASFAAALVVLGLVGAAPQVASASPDARIDQQIRPCFGLLLEPNLSKGCGARRPVKRKPPRRPYYPGGGYGPYRTVVDCDIAYPGEVNDVLARLYDGDTLTLVSRNGGACVESLSVTRSVLITARDYSPSRTRPILVAPADQPCIRIAPGVAFVVLQNLGLEASRGGTASCIVGRATELALKGVVVRYDGEASAIDVADSRVEMIQTAFVGRTRAPVVKLSGSLQAQDIDVAATAIGMAVETGRDSRLRDIRVVRLGDWSGSSRTRNSAGFVLTGVNRDQLVQIDGLATDGFSRGIYISGGETTLQRPVVRDSDWAVVLEGADLRVLDGRLEAADVGIYAASGVVYASDNAIAGVMRAGLFADSGAQIRARDNRVFARPGGCEALVTGYFDGALTCRPWFEAPELFRTPRDRARLDYDSYWPAGAVAVLSGPPSSALAGGPVDPYEASAAAGGPVGAQPVGPQGSPR
ncbi:hypothetical protein SGCZBJ_11455 [Caulobacter zeae]|uniref:Right handed beta helix domain-containing protein n=1 Tax=Caulobacter zeae TaxID=2055137 RepID=A0A2N5DGV3_9CAUL|nr:hypothetical protein [Caulobacter zeae]PLR25261.1 hypothetical protein SGCZBJ_11455 [Caulobacter zeae]